MEAFVFYETFAINYKTMLNYSSLHCLAVACCMCRMHTPPLKM